MLRSIRFRGSPERYTLRVWPLLPADLRTKACASLTRSMSASEWARYMGGVPYRRTCAALPPPEG